ncbi:DUF6090 family protein [Christiangramia lutea]
MRFFRKIRKKLFVDNKFSKYLLYAIGEIVLVVIGILIALAINNYNQERSLRNKEQAYLKGLKEEFQTSKIKLAELIEVNRNNYRGAKRLIELKAKEGEKDNVELSEIIYQSFSSNISFNPNNSLLTEMISSGSLKDIEDNELRGRLTNWFSRLEVISRQERELEHQRESVIDIFRSDAYSLRTILDQTGVSEEVGLPRSDENLSNLELMDSIKFENEVLLFILYCHSTEKAHYLPLMQEIDYVISLIDQELKI